MSDAPATGRTQFVACAVMFAATSAYSMSFPVLALFVERLTGHASLLELGILVAAYSAGKMLSAPVAGRLVALRGPRRLLLVQMTLLIGASALWYCAKSTSWLLLARFVLGVAGSASTPLRVVGARALVTKKAREQFASRLTAASTAGFLGGPAIVLLVTALPQAWCGFVPRAAPAMGGTVLGVVSALLVLATPSLDHDETTATRAASATATAGGNEEGATSRAALSAPPAPPTAPLWTTGSAAILLLQVAIAGPFASLEATITPLCAHNYNWGASEASAVFTSGAFATLAALALAPRAKGGRLRMALTICAMAGVLVVMAHIVVNTERWANARGAVAAPAPQLITGYVLYCVGYSVAQPGVWVLLYGSLYAHPRIGEVNAP